MPVFLCIWRQLVNSECFDNEILRRHLLEQRWWIQSQNGGYLLVTPHHVMNPERACKAVRQRITDYPIGIFLPSLCRYFGNGCGSSKINLQPLVDVIGLGTPGSSFTWSSYKVQTGEICSVALSAIDDADMALSWMRPSSIPIDIEQWKPKQKCNYHKQKGAVTNNPVLAMCLPKSKYMVFHISLTRLDPQIV